MGQLKALRFNAHHPAQLAQDLTRVRPLALAKLGFMSATAPSAIPFTRRLMSRWIAGVMVVLLCVGLAIAQPALAAEPPEGLEPTPTVTKPAFQQGVAAFQEKRFADAVEHFSRAIEEKPTSAAAYGDRCLSYLELGDYSPAIADCAKATTLNPTYSAAYVNWGLALHRSGDVQGAIDIYDRLLQFKPSDYRAFYNRGLAKIEQEHYRQAIVDFGQAIRQINLLDREKIAEVYIDRGVAQLLLGNASGAIADFSQAIQFNRMNGRAYFNRGCASHQLGQYRQAIDDFSQVIAFGEEPAEAYFNRGMMYKQIGDMGSAVADLRQAVYGFAQQKSLDAYQRTKQLLEQLQNSSPSSSVG